MLYHALLGFTQLWLFTDVSAQPNGPIFNGQAVHSPLSAWPIEEWTDKASRNVGNQLPTNASVKPNRAKTSNYAAAEAWIRSCSTMLQKQRNIIYMRETL
jgi:hypothetical protein